MGSYRRAAGLLAGAAILLGACATGGGAATPAAPTSAPPASEPPAATPAATQAAEAVEIAWYHIQNNDPGKQLWQDLADEYMDEHPNVSITLNVNENEPYKTVLSTLMQANTPPDLFQSWGGGGLREQVEAGLVQDITGGVADVADSINAGAMGMYQVDGKQYGIPFDLGMVGFWYNTDQFEQAAITEPPATWADLLAAVETLKEADITPIALAGQDTWTGAFYWAYLAVRECGQEGMDNAVINSDWSDPCFVKAGEDFMELIALEPFQEGFLGAKWDGAGSGAAAMATGNGAIQLMGQWLPGTVAANSDDPETPPEWLGWFPFPGVDGGAGAATDGIGGGNGFAVGRDAPPETIDFLKFLVSEDAANRWGALNTGILPTTVGTEGSVTDPQLVDVLAARAEAEFVQLYLDQATTPDLGAAINEAVATLYGGTGTPESVAEAIHEFAQQ